MKAILAILALGTALGYSAIETWTNKSGSTAEMELVKVTGEGDAKVGEFKLKNGKTVTIKATDLAEESAERLANWKPSETIAALAGSVFDEFLDGNLVRYEGKSFKRATLEKPTKYYLFYYTASWCPPCRKFTPDLVKFYDEAKADSKEFELVLITSDSSEEDMEEYAASAKMNWPQLKLSKVEKFRKQFKHPGTGIPNLVLTDLQGNIIKKSYEDGNYIGPAPVMNHLAQLLKK
jgi:thiol-disulfide isomerase/thioredoxin